jgi:hypothetical protein
MIPVPCRWPRGKTVAMLAASSTARRGHEAVAWSALSVRVPGRGQSPAPAQCSPRLERRPDVTIKIRPDKGSMPENEPWFQIGRWLAEPEDDGRADPNRSPGSGYFPRGGGHTCPVSDIP